LFPFQAGRPTFFLSFSPIFFPSHPHAPTITSFFSSLFTIHDWPSQALIRAHVSPRSSDFPPRAPLFFPRPPLRPSGRNSPPELVCIPSSLLSLSMAMDLSASLPLFLAPCHVVCVWPVPFVIQSEPSKEGYSTYTTRLTVLPEGLSLRPFFLPSFFFRLPRRLSPPFLFQLIPDIFQSPLRVCECGLPACGSLITSGCTAWLLSPR